MAPALRVAEPAVRARKMHNKVADEVLGNNNEDPQLARFKDAVKQVEATNLAANKFRALIAKDLWPTVGSLEKAGLIYSKGGTHDKYLSAVLDTLDSFKRNPELYMSTVFTGDLVRSIIIALQSQQPDHLKLREIKLISVSIDTLLESVLKYESSDIAYGIQNSRRAACLEEDEIAGDLDSVVRARRDTRAKLRSVLNEITTFVTEELATTHKDEHSYDLKTLYSKLSTAENVLSELKDLKQRMKSLEDEYIKLLEEIQAQQSGASKSVWPPNPIGSNPLLLCLRFGLVSTAIRVAERFFNTPEQLNQPSVNELDRWRVRKGIEQWEDGLYTGETALHIAIVMEDLDLVTYFLSKGACLESRASGIFFQPAQIPRQTQYLTHRERQKALSQGIDLKVDQHVPFSLQPNPMSGAAASAPRCMA